MIERVVSLIRIILMLRIVLPKENSLLIVVLALMLYLLFEIKGQTTTPRGILHS